MFVVVVWKIELQTEVGLIGHSFTVTAFKALVFTEGTSWPIIFEYASLKGLKPSVRNIFCLRPPKRKFAFFSLIECAYTRF
jgi:hypothetical protein